LDEIRALKISDEAPVAEIGQEKEQVTEMDSDAAGIGYGM
jgi:hypothetical protein